MPCEFCNEKVQDMQSHRCHFNNNNKQQRKREMKHEVKTEASKSDK